jgi:hypothetical protein
LTEDRRRGSSQQFTRGRAASAEGGGEERAERNRLKQCLGKVNLLAEGGTGVEEEERVKSIYNLLECLARY